MSFKIENIVAREILDSRGNPTVEVEVTSESGCVARASIPSGASTGSREAIEHRDGDKTRFGGKGVQDAVRCINTEINDALQGYDVRRQKEIDNCLITLDGTENKGRLGANAILGVSLAVSRTAAQLSSTPLYRYLGGVGANLLPVPCMNIINGGVHARWQGADFQEFMIAPWGLLPYVKLFAGAVRSTKPCDRFCWKKVYPPAWAMKAVLRRPFPQIASRWSLSWRQLARAGYRPGEDIVICMDPASSEFYADGKYTLRTENTRLSAEEMTRYYEQLVKDFPIVLIEDGLAEDDWAGWQILHHTLGDKVELVGDDIFVTNVKYIQRGIDENLANAALIKLNQIGTLSETIEAVQLCQDNNWGTFISHRSGETVDSFIADMTVGLRAGHLKTGAPSRGERIEKYNQLMRIEDELGDAAIFAGKTAFKKR